METYVDDPHSVTTWTRILDDLGYPALMVLGVAFVLWKFSRWATPWIEKLMNAHLEFVSDVKDAQIGLAKKQAESYEQIAMLAEHFRGLRDDFAEHRKQTEARGHARAGGD